MLGIDELNYIKNKIKKAFPYLKNVGVIEVSHRSDIGVVTLSISILCDSIIFNEGSDKSFSIAVNPNNLILAANDAINITAKQIATNLSIPE